MSKKVYIGQYLDSKTQTISGIVIRAPSYEANDGLAKMIISSYWYEDKVVLWLVIIDLDHRGESFDSFRRRFLVAKDQFLALRILGAPISKAVYVNANFWGSRFWRESNYAGAPATPTDLALRLANQMLDRPGHTFFADEKRTLWCATAYNPADGQNYEFEFAEMVDKAGWLMARTEHLASPQNAFWREGYRNRWIKDCEEGLRQRFGSNLTLYTIWEDDDD